MLFRSLVPPIFNLTRSLWANDSSKVLLSCGLKIGGTRPEKASTDRGFRGQTQVGTTQILMPKNIKEKTKYQQEVARKRFRARAAIEPTISHLKRNHSLGLNFLKGVTGDINNALLAGIGYNLKMRFNQIDFHLENINSQIRSYLYLNLILFYLVTP